MAHGAGLSLTITRLTRLIRQRRALYYGVRGLVWGLGLAVVAVALRAVIGPWALVLLGRTVLGVEGGCTAARARFRQRPLPKPRTNPTGE